MAHDEALIGCIGKLIVASRGAAGPGEVAGAASAAGRRPLLPGQRSRCREGATVLVIESRGQRAVDVSAWTDPLAEFDED